MLKGINKAAAVLSLLGDEISQKILASLPEEVAIKIIGASETLKTPTKEELLEAVTEFNDYMQIDMPAENLVIENYGATSAPNGTPIERIAGAQSEILARELAKERPEIAAFVLSHLEVDKIYEVLKLLGNAKEPVESRLISIKDVPIAKELEDKILKNISERLV